MTARQCSAESQAIRISGIAHDVLREKRNCPDRHLGCFRDLLSALTSSPSVHEVHTEQSRNSQYEDYPLVSELVGTKRYDSPWKSGDAVPREKKRHLQVE